MRQMTKKRLAAAVHHHHRVDDGHAFLGDPSDGDPLPVPGEVDAAQDLAGELGNEFMVSVTSNADMGEQTLSQINVSEVGGPFLEVGAQEEVADDNDANNPPGATKEPFPTPMRAGLLPTDPPLEKPEDR